MCEKECSGCVEEQKRIGTEIPMKIIKVRKLSMSGGFVESYEEVPDI